MKERQQSAAVAAHRADQIQQPQPKQPAPQPSQQLQQQQQPQAPPPPPQQQHQQQQHQGSEHTHAHTHHHFSDAAYRREFLDNHPQSRKLFVDLVHTGKITEAEFWDGVMSDYGVEDVHHNQQRGVLSGFNSAFNGQTVDNHSVTYSLTKEHIDSIFNMYPKIAKLYQELVPTQYSEDEFFQKVIVEGLKSQRALDRSDPFFEAIESAKQYVPISSRRVKATATFDPLTDVYANEVEEDVPEEHKGSEKKGEIQAKARKDLMSKLNSYSAGILDSFKTKENSALVIEERSTRLRTAIELDDLDEENALKFAPLPISRAEFQSKLSKQVTTDVSTAQSTLDNVPQMVAATSPLEFLLHRHQESLKATTAPPAMPKELEDEVHAKYKALSELLRLAYTRFKVVSKPGKNEGDVTHLQRLHTLIVAELQDLTTAELSARFGEHEQVFTGIKVSLKSFIDKYDKWSKKPASK